MDTKSHKYIIHYFLIACIALIQIIILIFFYNEYFNGRRLSRLEKRIQTIQLTKEILNDTKNNLSEARLNLEDYIQKGDKKSLSFYFESIQKLNNSLESLDDFRAIDTLLYQSILSEKKRHKDIVNLQMMIDSVFLFSKQKLPEPRFFQIEQFKIIDSSKQPLIQIENTVDSLPKKKFFARLKDAFRNNVEVVKEVTTITSQLGDTLVNETIQNYIDSVVQVLNTHYLDEIERVQKYQQNAQKKHSDLYKIYENLISYSEIWMGIYTSVINDFNQDLTDRYAELNSLSNRIRRYSVLGLMILMFGVLAVVTYYTRQAFLYEKELKDANLKIELNLNFKNRILGMLSHEIKAPLRIINLLINRIEQRKSDMQSTEYLDSIKFTNNSLLIQATQILEYAKDQSTINKIQLTETNLENETESIIKAFKPYIEYKGNRLIWKNHMGQLPTVLTDKVKIHQIFMNILGNANKFTENGSITVVTEAVEKENTVNFTVEISDTGIGISESDLKMIFEPYYQGIISEEVENIGAGLGLNLCKEIMDKLGGEISVTSQLNAGTKVRFSIDLNKSA